MRVISGTARGIPLKALEGMTTRPTADRVKEALFSIIQFELPGARVLDLFGGSGQLGIEALSRGAKSAVFVDQSDKACGIIRENLKRTKFQSEALVVRGDYLQYLSHCKEQYEIILLDPPYAEDFLEKALNAIAEIDILQSGGIMIAERPVGKEIQQELPGFSRSRDYKYGNTLLALYRKD